MFLQTSTIYFNTFPNSYITVNVRDSQTLRNKKSIQSLEADYLQEPFFDSPKASCPHQTLSETAKEFER